MTRLWVPMRISLIFSITFVFVSASATAATIDFSNRFGAHPGQTQLTDQLADYGVVFAGEGPNGAIWHGTGSPASFHDTFNGGFLPSGFGDTSPIRISFVTPNTHHPWIATAVSIRAFDGGGDLDVFTLVGYGNFDEVIASATFGPDDFGTPGHTLAITGRFAYVRLLTGNTTSGLFFDDLDFTLFNVPEPNTALLLSIGLVGMAAKRKRLS